MIVVNVIVKCVISKIL